MAMRKISNLKEMDNVRTQVAYVLVGIEKVTDW